MFQSEDMRPRGLLFVAARVSTCTVVARDDRDSLPYIIFSTVGALGCDHEEIDAILDRTAVPGAVPFTVHIVP